MRETDQLLLGKEEATYSVDPNPTGSDVVWCREVDETIIESDEEEETNLQPEFGSRAMQTFAIRRGLNFTVPVVGAAAPGDALPEGFLLKSCGMSENLIAVTSAEYKLSKLSTDSSSMRRFKGGNLFNYSGCRGSWVLSMSANKVLERKFDFKGLRKDVANTSMPPADFTAWKKPIALLPVAGASFALHGYAGALEALEIDLGNEFDYEGRIGSEEIEINGRQMKGSITIVAVPEATKAFVAACENDVIGPLALVIVGSGSGTQRKLTINCPNVQLRNPKYVSIGTKKQGLQMDIILIPSAAGDDEYSELWEAVA